MWTGGSLHSDTQLLWILLQSESPGVGKLYKGSTAPALRLPGAHSSCKAETTALTLDFRVSISVPPPSSRVTLAEFLFRRLCHEDDNTGQGCAGLPGRPVGGLVHLQMTRARVQRRHEGGFPEKANIPVTARNAFQRKQESGRKKGRPGTLAFVTMSRGAGSHAPFLL